MKVHKATRWTIRHGLMLLWFTDLMNVTEEITIHRPNVSTLLTSAFIRDGLNATTRGHFRHSGVLQLTWLTTQCLHGVILIAALQKVPEFLGYKEILHRLKFLPSFWTLIVLAVVLLSRFATLSLSSESSLQMLILIVFSMSYVVKILLIGFLNYTQLKMLKYHHPKRVFYVLSKLALFVFVVECVVSFVMSFIAMLLKVEEIQMGKREELSGVMRTSDILRQISVAFFRLRILSFFWNKLFVDDKNILSNFENLPHQAFLL